MVWHVGIGLCCALLRVFEWVCCGCFGVFWPGEGFLVLLFLGWCVAVGVDLVVCILV